MGRGLRVTKRRGVSGYISKGKMYYRFRLKGKPEVSLLGEPFSPEFEEAYRRAMKGEVVPGEFRTVEGSMATRLADAGCSEVQIKAITGHVTAKEVERYTKARDQRVLAEAAMAKI